MSIWRRTKASMDSRHAIKDALLTRGLPASLTISGMTYQIKVTTKPKRSSSASIRDRVVELRLSSRLSQPQQLHHALQLLKKVQNSLSRATHRVHAPFLFDKQVTQLSLMGQSYEVVWTKQRKRVVLDRASQTISLSAALKNMDESAFSKSIRQELAKLLLPDLTSLVSQINEQTLRSRDLRKVAWREQTTRWGSCSARGSINLSSRLIFMPLPLLRYVIIHELCHLKYRDHQSRFWALVGSFEPEYKALRKRLRNH